jgi:hypothetical protein
MIMIGKEQICTTSDEIESSSWHQLDPHDPFCTSPGLYRQQLHWLLAQGAQAFVFTREGKPVFRALLFAHGEPTQVAALGMMAWAEELTFEDKKQLLLLLLARLRTQHARCGFNKLLAPMNGLTWFSYRLRTDELPLAWDWEPPRSPFLWQLLSECGFVTDTLYHSFVNSHLEQYVADTAQDFRRCVEAGYRFEPVGAEFMQGEGIKELFALSVKAFENNHYFKPITLDAFSSLYLRSQSSLQQSFTAIARHEESPLAGYMYNFLDEKMDAVVLKNGGVAARDRGKGLSNALVHYICTQMVPRLPANYVSALVRAGLNSESYSKHSPVIARHDYELLSRLF